MRTLAVVLLALVACDLRPAPKDRPAPPPAQPSTGPVKPHTPQLPPDESRPPPDAGVAVVLAPTDAATRPVVDAMEVNDTCVDVSAHVAAVVIDSVQDPAHKAVYVQERARMVRRSAEACTRDAWSAERIGCYFASKTPDAIQDCNKAHPPI